MEVIGNDAIDPMPSVFDDEMDVADVFASPEAKDHDRPGTPLSQPSIDFSAATPDSKAGFDMPLPFDEPLEAHDSFDFEGGLDIFSDGEDNKSMSDISDDETRKKPKQRKSKPIKERKALKPKKEEPELRKVSVVETEIEVVKKLETGPSAAELRRRQLIEIDQDEFEERVEKLNKVTLQVMAKSLGLTKEEQLQKIIECREFLKPHWDDGEMGDFIEETIDKINSRLYGTTTVPANGADAMDYLDRASYSDDDWIDEPEDDRKAPVAPVVPVEEAKQAVTEVTPAKAGMIELSDSDNSDEEDEEEVGGAGRSMTVTTETAATVRATATASASAPSAPAVVTPQDMARLRLAKLERQRAAAAEREAIELEQRRLRYLAAAKAPKNARQALLIALRQKVQQTAKENYCNQRKISSEQLALRLKIAEKCRQLAELLKERHEARDLHKREARRAKFQEMADADEMEFDEDGMGGLAEGQYLTAEEKAAILRGFEEDDASESEIESEAEEGTGDEEAGGDGEGGGLPGIRPVDEELQGVRGLRRKGGDESQADDEQEGDGEGDNAEAEETQQQVAGDDDEGEDEEVVKVVRGARSRPVSSVEANTEGADEGPDDTDGHTGAARPAPLSVLRKYGSKASKATAAEEGEGEAMDLDADSVAASAAVPSEEQADTGSVDNRTLASGHTHKKDKERRKKQSTGNALYRLALEEEERRSRRQKSNMFLEDEAAEEEEEGLQAGLGDFGFGVTSNIREHDEEMAALKVRKGDFDHIVDDVSEDEGDEAAGAAARAEMELQEDRARDRAIITAVTEGHDALRKMQKKGKYTFDKLVGDRRADADNNTADQPAAAAEDEWDEEEMLQRGMKERFDREFQTRARRGRNADSDSDSAEGSDTEDNLLDQLDTSGMTEEEKAQEIERLRRLQERNRMDALMAKQRTLSYKMARARVQQEKLQRKLLLRQQSQQDSQSGAPSTGLVGSGPSLLRQGSVGLRPAVTRSLTLEPLQDEYSRLLASTMSMASATATTTSAAAAGSSSLLMAPASTSSSSGVSPRNFAGVTGSAATLDNEESKLKDITNHPEQQVKRRTMQAPKHASTATAGLRRGHTVYAGSGHHKTKGLSVNVEGGLYKSELNQLEVESGYGMGMALPSSTRHSVAPSMNGKTDISGGLFSAVTGGLRRFGDLGKAVTAGAGSGNGAAAGGNALKKRTFSEVGKLSSTVAAQQFVFASSATTASYSLMDESSQQFSRMGGESSLGFGASRTTSMSNAAGASRPRVGGETGKAPGGSLFAQLGAKRGGGLKSASTRQ